MIQIYKDIRWFDCGQPVPYWEEEDAKENEPPGVEPLTNDSYKFWAKRHLGWMAMLHTSAASDTRRYWSQSSDHWMISLLAINSRFHNLPKFITEKCPRMGYCNLVTMNMVNQLAVCNKDTVLKIVKEGIDRNEIRRIKNPPHYPGINFTAGYNIMKPFSSRRANWSNYGG